TRDHNEKFKAILGELYGSKPEATECRGCMQPDPPELLYGFCTGCSIRKCVKDRGFYSCHQCGEAPCKYVKNFPFPVGKKVMRRAIPEWRAACKKLGADKGDVAFAKTQFDRYRCPSCGQPLFRGAKRCKACKAPVDVD
nr:DUF3795 domain-containing protein [Candidatus Sigynarchaeota archaeon]